MGLHFGVAYNLKEATIVGDFLETDFLAKIYDQKKTLFVGSQDSFNGYLRKLDSCALVNI